jgi:hypothetical protein
MDPVVVSAFGEKLVFKMDPTGGIGTIDGNRISLNPGVEINGLKVASGSLVKNESGQWQVEKLTFEITRFGSLPLNSKGFMEVDGQGNKTIVLPGESLGMNGATFRFDGGTGFNLQKGTDLYQIGAGTIEQGGVTYQIQNLQLNRDKASTILVGAILTKDNQPFVINTRGDIISTDELVQRVADLGMSWKEVSRKVQVLESKLGSAYDDVATKINGISVKFGEKGTFKDTVDLSGSLSAEWQMEKVRETVKKEGSSVASMVEMIKTGRPDVAFSLIGTGGPGFNELAKNVGLIGEKVDQFNGDAGKFVKSFELLNLFSANKTEQGMTRVQDQVGLAKAYGDFKSSLKSLVLNPMTSEHVKGELMKLYSGVEALRQRPVDMELFKREGRGTFKGQPELGAREPRLRDWILYPRGTFLRVSTSWMNLSPARQAKADKILQIFDRVESLIPKNNGSRVATAVMDNHVIERMFAAAIDFTEDLQREATASKADFQTQLASALNPVRFVERTYRWLEINGDQPGSQLGAAGIFTLGIAMTVFEVLNPTVIVAMGMPTIIQRDVKEIGEVAGWSRDSTEKWGERLGLIASVATFSAGGFKESPSVAEFGIKTAVFYGSAVAVTGGSRYAVAHWNVGGDDKDLANEVVESMVNGGLMVGAKYVSKAATALETYAGEKSSQVLRFKLKAEALMAKREALVQESAGIDQQIQTVKTDLAVEAAVAKEIESLYNIQKNNAPEGAQRGTRPIRTDAGAGGELDQGSYLGVLLAEAQRAGEAQRSVRRRVGAAEEGIRDLESRKRSVGSEIRRTDSQIERLRGARAKAESVVVKTFASGVGLRILSLLAQSDEPLFDQKPHVSTPKTPSNKGIFKSIKELISNERGSILVEPISVRQAFKNLWESLTGTKAVSSNATARGPTSEGKPVPGMLVAPTAAPKTIDATVPGPTIVKGPQGRMSLDGLFLENAAKTLTPEQVEKFKQALESPERVNEVSRIGQDRARLRVRNPLSGITVEIDHLGHVVNYTELSPSAHLASTPMIEASSTRAGPQAQNQTGYKEALPRANDLIVLGHYPEYVNLSQQLNAKRFNIPADIWKKMSDPEKWVANQKFLDRAILRGIDIVLATPLDKVKPGSYFEREINYLFNQTR